jgi:hypothetical protein
MPRTDQQRYDEALQYLKGIDMALGNEVHAKVGGRSTAVGAEISLGGEGYWRVGSDAQHRAVRALLLLQITYFRPPHCRGTLADAAVLDATRRTFKGKHEALVRDAILDYTRPANRSHHGLAQAALQANQAMGNLDPVNLRRTDQQIGANPICYNGLTLWLFAGGFVSKRWLAGPGNKIDANNADQAFGTGVVVAPDQWDALPMGYLWTIQRRNDPTTCHWGLSLGDGKAAASNNTPGSPFLMLELDSGDSKCGTFTFTQMCAVLNSDFKYGHTSKDPPSTPDANIVVKKIDPATSTALF